ncbi:T9SS type A sorting domain-containing protein [Hymenobacter bucti]|uniref:T9SS type A sorting domain-containing protein n=1 Tax=Hymenobacter bucti TaxID=1844114 RepID=A0ABW4R2R3_9BACT
MSSIFNLFGSARRAAPLASRFSRLLVLGAWGALPLAAHAQLALPSAAPVTQNFDGIGTSATATLPTGFKFSPDAMPTYGSATNYLATTVATTGNNFTAGGTYNFGSTVGATDRAVGFLNSGSYTSPRHILLQVQNTSGAVVQDLSVQFDIEKYRSGSRAYDFKFYVSTDGSTWVSQPAGDQSYPADGSNTVYSYPPLTTSKQVTLTGVAIAPGAPYYLRWSDVGLNGSTNGQGLGLDNVVLTPTLAGGPTPTPVATITTSSLAATSFCLTSTTGSPSFSVAFTSSGAFTGTYLAQLSDAVGVFPTNTTDNIIGSGPASPLTASLPAGTPSGNGYRIRVLNDAPLTTGTDNGQNLTVTQAPSSNTVTVSPATSQTLLTTATGATLTATATSPSTFAWYYSTSAVGSFTTAIAGATAASYTLKGADFGGAGTYYLVARATTTTTCGAVSGLSAPIAITVTAPPVVVAPTLTVSLTTLPDFGSIASGAASPAKSFTVSGTNLTGAVTVTPPAGFEIRTGAKAFACCAIELTPVGGAVSATIEVRFVPTVAQTYAAAIAVSSPGVAAASVSVTGTGMAPVYPATVSTAAITALTPTGATSGGTVEADGGSAVTARGVVWSLLATPALTASKTVDGAGAGSFTSTLSGLLPGTTYFGRAYATNAAGTAYGEEFSFTTVAIPLAAEPTNQSTLTASAVTSTSLQLNLTGGTGTKHLILARLTTAVNATPVDATTYLADAAFGAGTQLGTGNYVVYAGTGSSVTVTGLRASSTYTFAVFDYNDNDTPYAENYLTTAPGTLSQATPDAPAALLLEENFDYRAGTDLKANNWTAHSGTTNAVKVTTGGLSYAGYNASGIGNAAALTGNGEDVSRTFASLVMPRTPVYVSYLVNVASATAAGDYYLHLGPAPLGSNFYSRVFVRRSTTSGKVQFGISGSSTATYSTTDYDLNTTYLLVVKYTFDENGNLAQLFVNPAGDTEPTTATVSSAETSAAPANIGTVALRQGSSSPNLVVDGLRVGNTYRVVKTGLVCLPPTPKFTAAPVCVGTPTAFADASTTVEANATYAWDVDGDGQVDYTTKGAITHTYPAAGTYSATLTITQGACADVYTQAVIVRALPTATLSGTSTICAGSSAELSVHLTGTAPWTISYSATGDPTATTVSVAAADVTPEGTYALIVRPATTTTYTLTAVTDSNCTGTALTGSATVTVNTAPVLTVPVVPTTPAQADLCGASVAFAATATGSTPAPVLTYAITQQGTLTAITSPYVFPVGTTVVTATATNSCGDMASKTFTVTVQDRQAPTVRTQNINVALVNGTATITAAQVNNGSSDNCSGTLTYRVSPSTFSCANIGPNTVTLTVTDASGNQASGPATVTVTGSIPAPTISVAPANATYTGGVPTTLYLGYGPQSATLTASGAGSGGTYQWSPAIGLSSSTIANPVFTATTAGTFTYTVTATSASGCSATKSVTLTVVDVRCSSNGKKLDKVIVCHHGSPLCIDADGVADHLKHGDPLGACSGNVQAASLARMAAAPEDASEARISFEAYPNPFSSSTTLRFQAAQAGTVQLQVYNALGQLVATLYHGPVQRGEVLERTLDGTGLNTGLYTCRLTTEGQTLTQRVMLSK